MSFPCGSRLSLSGTSTWDVEPLKPKDTPVWVTSVGVPLLLLPDQSSICPSVSSICHSAPFSSTAHAGEAIEAITVATVNNSTMRFTSTTSLPMERDSSAPPKVVQRPHDNKHRLLSASPK